MAFEFKLPDLGEGIQEAQIISVLVEQGQSVTEDQAILEVETDKAAVEIPVPRAGRIARLMVKAGDTVTVGQVLVVVEEAGGVPEPAEVAAQPAVAPRLETRVAAGPSAVGAASGGDGSVKTAAAEAIATGRMAAPVTPAARPIIHKGPVPATPAVRRLAREWNIDLRTIPGSGPGGRVLRADLEQSRAGGVAPAAEAAAPAAVTAAESPAGPLTEAGARAAPPSEPAAVTDETPRAEPQGEALPDFSHWGPITREAVPQIRKTIARQMTRSWLTVPRVTHADEADLTDLEAFRRQHKQSVADAGGGKLTITAFLLKALAATLQRHPKLNASYDDRTHEIIWKQYVHIGVAVDTPRGLIVPALRDVDKKSLAAIAADLKDLSDRIRENKFDLAELRGGTFTLSNVGALGGTFSTPMVNYPETAILVTGRLAKKPVVRDDRIVARWIMPLALSFDHRIIDGGDAARFMNSLIEFLEHPVTLLLTA